MILSVHFHSELPSYRWVIDTLIFDLPMERHSLPLIYSQSDQMARFFVQHSAIYINKNLP